MDEPGVLYGFCLFPPNIYLCMRERDTVQGSSTIPPNANNEMVVAYILVRDSKVFG